MRGGGVLRGTPQESIGGFPSIDAGALAVASTSFGEMQEGTVLLGSDRLDGGLIPTCDQAGHDAW